MQEDQLRDKFQKFCQASRNIMLNCNLMRLKMQQRARFKELEEYWIFHQKMQWHLLCLILKT